MPEPIQLPKAMTDALRSSGVKDSGPDTQAHINRVQELLGEILKNVIQRGAYHDRSKLQSPEKEAFDATTELKGMTYGSDDYKAALERLGPALKHHYEHNSHHPEHYINGVWGMSLLDLIEMLADWKAAGERHADGSMKASLTKNRSRFGVDDQLQFILENTAKEMGWL